MKPFFLGLLLGLAIIIGIVAYYVFTLPDTSVEAWRKETGYKGLICFVTYDKKEGLHCLDKVPYNKGTVNAKEGYDIWVTCKELPSAPVCRWD